MKSWDERADNYLTWKEGISPSLVKRNLIYKPILKRMLGKKIKEIDPKSLLEVGCGPGRLFSLYQSQGISAVCVDMSSRMLERADCLRIKKRYNNISLLKGDVCDLHLYSCFDMVITSNVLLHISHDKINSAIENICRYGKDIVCVEWVDKNSKDTDGCYLHDYVSLFARYGFELVDSKKILFEKQELMHFKKG